MSSSDSESVAIHVNGHAGAGKSELAKQLSKLQCAVVDLDALDDPRKIAATPKIPKAGADDRKWRLGIGKQVTRDVMEVIDRDTTGVVVLVGVLHFDPTVVELDYRFALKIDPAANYRQLCSRTVDNICSNAQAIRGLIGDSSARTEMIHQYCVNKYKVRMPFIVSYERFLDDYDRFYLDIKEMGYVTGSAAVIYSKISKIISGSQRKNRSAPVTKLIGI